MTSIPFHLPDSTLEIIKTELEKRYYLKTLSRGVVPSNLYINPVIQEIKHLVFVIEGIQTDLIDLFFKEYTPKNKKIVQHTIISIQPLRKKIIKHEQEFIEQLQKKWNVFGFVKIHEPDIKNILQTIGVSTSDTLIVMQIKKTQFFLLNKKGVDILFSMNSSLLLLLK